MSEDNLDFSFENSVFINCPFDPSYEKLLRSCIFTVLACGFDPVCALEVNDGGQRIHKITDLIKRCMYGIHDISLVDLDKKNQLPRFNMPFELGLDLGCKTYAGAPLNRKNFLIFECREHDLQKYLSDLSGIDAQCHNMSPETAIGKIRNWLNSAAVKSGKFRLPGDKLIIEAFDRFLDKLSPICTNMQVDIKDVSYNDLLHAMRDWIMEYPGLIYS